MHIEMIINKPFEEYRIIKGCIPDPIWKSLSGLCSVKFITEDGEIYNLPLDAYVRLKLEGIAYIPGIYINNKIVSVSLKVVKKQS
jgi:hypothetical protein